MIDAHVHLNNYIKDKKLLSVKDVEKEIDILSTLLDNYNVKKGLLYILDTDWICNKLLPLDFPNNIILGLTIDIFADKVDYQLDAMINHNIKVVKLLPYEQKIFKSNYRRVLDLAKKIEERNMVLTVCCAYGSQYVYDTNGVKLVAYLLNNEIRCPIIMAHGGMVKVFDAMSLMLDFPNLYMDISFTLPYWKGSRIWDDYAFVLQKLSYDRVFYGSDYPYVSIKESKNEFEEFCKKYGISNENKEKIYYRNFKRFLRGVNL